MLHNQRKAIITDEHRIEAARLRSLWDAKPALARGSQAQFGKKFGIGNQSAVAQFLSGISPLSLNAAKGFAQGLGCKISDFSQRLANEADSLLSVSTANTAPGPEVRGAVPLLSSVQAGRFKEYVDNHHAGDGGMEQIPTSVPIKAHTFALRVAGDSMEPEFHDGMVLIVEPEMDAQPGDFVIAKNGSDETTFKQLIKDGGDWYLKPLNQRYPIKPLGDSRIIGVVRAVERRFR